jgi:uncharacterized protein
MEIQNSFNVPLPPADAWRVLMDIPRITPCVPGAELIEQVDARTYRGKVSVRLGPIALTFAGIASFESLDESAHLARVRAQGTDSKGRGGAAATVDFRLEPVPEGTSVLVTTDVNLTGSVAQYGRASGIIQGIANHIMAQFAENLKKLLDLQGSGSQATPDRSGQRTPRQTPAESAAAVSGLSLIVRALWDSIRRLLIRQSSDGMPRA